MHALKKCLSQTYLQKLTFKNRNGEEYEFGKYDNKDTPIACPEEVPFPDIPAEAPGILTGR